VDAKVERRAREAEEVEAVAELGEAAVGNA
jgi:hypothetical protein